MPSIVAGSLSPRPTKALVVDAAAVKAVPAQKDARLIDARAPVFYKGIEPTYEKSGHIPGAINIPFTEIADARLVIDRDRLAQLFENAGVGDGDAIVAYCHIGQQATAVIFAARLLGHRVALYDGAFQDWAVNNRGAVEK
jgi:thiosulfate/3-mercaptopyruvate sulfurtransferase